MTSATVEDLAYPVAGGGEVDAYLVSPVDGTASGGVLFLHWFDPQADDGNRTQFIDEAKTLAAAGIVSLLPQQAFPWSFDPAGSTADAAAIEAELGRLGAGVELLARRGAQRLALVGHDFGAMHGLLLMARDARLGAGVAIAPANRWGDWFLRFWQIEEDRIDYLRGMRPFDPIEQVAQIAPRPLLLQFAADDYFIAGMDAAELYRAAGEPREVRTYAADHALRDEQARSDRQEFLARLLA